MATPHIDAAPGDFAPAVLMPGDPRRARRIAETLFDDARLINEVRNMWAFTGTVEGRPISVMGSGMGQPSMTLYATELFRFFGVRRIVRVGTCGAYPDALRIGDVVIASGAHTDSSINDTRIPGVRFAPTASFALARSAVEAAEQAGITAHVGPVFSSDHFYLMAQETTDALRDHGTLAIDMETAALYGVAAAEGGEALTVLTVSDHLYRHEQMSPEEREVRVRDAASLAIAAALS
jgi:purine-nucleoside phosphorylase